MQVFSNLCTVYSRLDHFTTYNFNLLKDTFISLQASCAEFQVDIFLLVICVSATFLESSSCGFEISG